MTPHTFVLLEPDTEPTPPDANARTPDHLLEELPGVFEAPCPKCLGEGSLEEEGSAYWSPQMEAFYPSLDVAFRPCDRCHAAGTVLDYLAPALRAEARAGRPESLKEAA